MKVLLLLATLSFGAAVLSFAHGAQPPTHPHLVVVVEKGLPGATLYDADTDQPLCDANVGVMSPHEAAFSPDGRALYVPIYGSTNEGVPGTNEHTIDFFRTSDCQKTASLDTGQYLRPHGMWVDRSGTLYVTSEITQSVLLIDPRQPKIVATIATGSPWTHMIAVTSDEKQMFTSNVRSKTISVIDIPNRKITKTITTTSDNHRMTISPDEKWFVTSLVEGKVLFYKISDDSLDFSVDVDGWAFVGKFAADGTYYEMGSGTPRTPNAPWGTGPVRVWKIDPVARKVVATATDDLGSGTGSLAVNPFNGKIYVSAMTSNQVDVLDPATLKLLKRIPTKDTPDCIEFTTVQ
jgi:YVTN family beta-propeller protein